MPKLPRVLCTLVVASLGLGASAPTVAAQEASQPRAQNVISANPIGRLFDFFNAEYERSTSVTSTIGVGGSTFSADDDFGDTQRYLNFDNFFPVLPIRADVRGLELRSEGRRHVVE